MKSKMILEIVLPASNMQIEVKIPRQLKIGQVKNMLVDFLKKQGGEYIPTQESMLCDMESGTALDVNLFIENVGLHNGSRLMPI